jgi:hypothetical protein
VLNLLNKVGSKPMERCASLRVSIRIDLSSKLMHFCDAAYCKQPAL